MTHPPQQPLDELQALCARQFERLDEIATALANGAYYADDPECHPLYPQAVAARQILQKSFTSLHQEIQRLREDRNDLIFLHDALAAQIEEALGTPGGKQGGFPGRIQRLREALSAIEKSAFVANTHGNNEPTKIVALESIEDIARDALSPQENKDDR